MWDVERAIERVEGARPEAFAWVFVRGAPFERRWRVWARIPVDAGLVKDSPYFFEATGEDALRRLHEHYIRLDPSR